MKSLAILGSTGSIGESTLKVVEQFPDRFKVVALAAGKRTDRLAEQAIAHGARIVCCAKSADAKVLESRLGPGVEICHGEEGLRRVATFGPAEMVVSALVGSVGLKPTHAALCAGKDVALANKEVLVVAGEAMIRASREHHARLLPVDSEHSAIFQVLDGKAPEEVNRLILTASGGPFRGKKASEFADIPAETALKHPNWSMGPKITIDSATMMNKGLEVIEAHWLFNVSAEKIEVVIHPQSIIHSMVEFIDGSILAQMGVPDMRGPIGHTLAYPSRLPLARELALDFSTPRTLTFEAPDWDSFPCLGLAYEALRTGGTAPAILSGANEVAVAAYLSGKISFGEIGRLVRDALHSSTPRTAPDVETALEADRLSREFALSWVRAR